MGWFDQKYLTHYERVCLLYTLTFAGEQGAAFLHKVMGHTLNYDYDQTQKYIDRRKQSPVSCAKIRENFHDLARSVCTCKFDLPPRSYPSPVMYALAAELDGDGGARPFPGRRRAEENEQTEETAEKDERQESISERNIAKDHLDFKDLFQEEGLDTSIEQIDVSDYISEYRKDEGPDAKMSPIERRPEVEQAHNVRMGNKGTSEGVPACEPKSVPSDIPTENPSETDGCSMFVEYLWLKRRRKEIEERLRHVRLNLEKLFEKSGSRGLTSPLGSVEKVRNEDGTWEWTLRLVENGEGEPE